MGGSLFRIGKTLVNFQALRKVAMLKMRLNMLLNGCDSLSIQFFKSKLGIPSGPDVILLESFLAATFI